MAKRRRITPKNDLSLLAVPPPYRAWLTICNDPDFTTLERWKQIHSLIWEKLQLPFADSFFLTNLNDSLPNQINLRDHPEILDAHPHDTMHTWGDYINARRHRFDRNDAVAAVERLRDFGVTPRIWTDHSNFSGNLLHRPSRKAAPMTEDSAGHQHPNFEYTLDLIREAGVRYVWDGKLTNIPGQDRTVSKNEWYGRSTKSLWKCVARSVVDTLGGPLWKALDAGFFNYRSYCNRQYAQHTFPDGQSFYRFVRFGRWLDGDIDTLPKQINKRSIERLIESGGTCIFYTHLGKPAAERLESSEHLPSETIDVFQELARRYKEHDLKLSGTAELLDYLVLRDHAVTEERVDFRADGIRYESLEPDDLAGMTFGVHSNSAVFEVTCEGAPVDCNVVAVEPSIYRLEFPPRP